MIFSQSVDKLAAVIVLLDLINKRRECRYVNLALKVLTRSIMEVNSAQTVKLATNVLLKDSRNKLHALTIIIVLNR